MIDTLEPITIGPFTPLEMSHIRECALERGISVTTLIRQAVMDDLYR